MAEDEEEPTPEEAEPEEEPETQDGEVSMVDCPFCGESYKETGLHTHLRGCGEVPDDMGADEAYEVALDAGVEMVEVRLHPARDRIAEYCEKMDFDYEVSMPRSDGDDRIIRRSKIVEEIPVEHFEKLQEEDKGGVLLA